MFIIKTIKLSLGAGVKASNVTRVRVGYDQYICNSKRPPHFLATPDENEGAIEWKEDMTLPIIYRQQLQFQFFPQHSYGFSPEQLSQVYSARVLLSNYKKGYAKSSVTDLHGNEVGQLYFQFAVVNEPKNKCGLTSLENSPHKEAMIKVSSILAHFQSEQGKRGCFELSIDGETQMTPQVDFIAGQLLWAQALSFPLGDILGTQQLLIRMFLDDRAAGLVTINVKDIIAGKDRRRRLAIRAHGKSQKCGVLFVNLEHLLANDKDQGLTIGEGRNKSGHLSYSFLPLLNSKSHSNNTKQKGTAKKNPFSRLSTVVSLEKQSKAEQRVQAEIIKQFVRRRMQMRERDETIVSKYLKYYK